MQLFLSWIARRVQPAKSGFAPLYFVESSKNLKASEICLPLQSLSHCQQLEAISEEVLMRKSVNVAVWYWQGKDFTCVTSLICSPNPALARYWLRWLQLVDF